MYDETIRELECLYIKREKLVKFKIIENVDNNIKWNKYKEKRTI